MPIDGTSFAYTFNDAKAPSRKTVQFFDNNGSRGIYQDGWFAGTFGPLVPWDTAGSVARIEKWDSAKDEWELYKLEDDFSQARNLADTHPEKLAGLKADFLALAEENKDFPIGAGIWLRIYPQDRISSPYTSWSFSQNTRRMPEFAAPGVGRQSTEVVIDLEMADGASGVLYAVGGAGGGLTVYLDDGYLVYEYNMLILEQYVARSVRPLGAGTHRVRVVTDISSPGGAGTATLSVDGAEVAAVQLNQTVPAAFTATESFDVGIDLGSTVSVNYYDRRPFAFDGQIEALTVRLLDVAGKQ
jgi:arylsulfatase